MTTLHPDEMLTLLGATRLATGQTLFRVWAPDRQSVELVLDERRRVALRRDDTGHWYAIVDALQDGALYGYVLDGNTDVLPDPVSRFQPHGPHGRSQLVDATKFQWHDAAWSGIRLAGQVLYELHIGTFTQDGTWQAARARLPALAALGVTALEVMPVADFPGRFGWGYDGTCFYAPHHCYGEPDDFRSFVDAAHGLGIAVILDVVYNHVGPDGNYLPQFCPRYFSENATEWGTAFNYDGRDSRAVRDFIAGNAEYWIREYHLDGFRLDATQSMFDSSAEHIIAELSRRARAAAAGRNILIVAENEPQDTDLVRAPVRGGQGLDALWNDDFHHSAIVALLGMREAYYTDYLGRANELVAAIKHGYLYQGQRYAWQKQRRGKPAFDLQPRHFVAFLENHDQVANTPHGKRLCERAQPAAQRAMTALLLLGPWTPMLFQGQEFSSEKCFAYFADFDGELARLVKDGRAESLKQFPSYASRAAQADIPAPSALSTFERCKLDWAQGPLTQRGRQALALHRDLLALRRDEPVLRACLASDERRFEAAVLTEHALALRYFAGDGDLLLVVNLSGDRALEPAPEPLLAPPRDAEWRVLWSSEEPQYGGSGTPDGWTDADGWHLPGYCARLLKAHHVA